ncbi:MAG TPA: FAD-dependent oxidoreductase [Acidimicrobiales bacterium]|nr:FAD-dependent oxidoreductase [Acidimicrobiales bacterium]
MSVVVVGSGAAGLSAALAAAVSGADVVVLEASPWVGGTTAMSGGVVWAPGNHLAGDEAERRHDREQAGRYLRALGGGGLNLGSVDAFVDDVGRVVRTVGEHTALCWELLESWPDYRGDLPGASVGRRSLWPAPLALPWSVAARVRPDPAAAAGGHDGAAAHDDGAAAHDDGAVLRGPVRGRVLVGALLAALADLGVEVRTACRVAGLMTGSDGVAGVVLDGERLEGRVVLASGGFQFDVALAEAHLGGVPVAAMGEPCCTGDGLRMAERAGATLVTMDEGWWMPAMSVPGEQLEGAAFFRPLHSERAQPGAVVVDGSGRRFVDEAQNYGDVGQAMRRVAPGAPGAMAPRWWMVFDGAYRERYPVGPLAPGDLDPPWLTVADDVAGLARILGLDALEDTVARFNAGAERGVDPDFGRGEHPYDRWIGDPGAAHPTLAALTRAPYYALEVHLGCMGTKGGPRTDDRGRVLGGGAWVCRGLYAAGNAAGSPFGSVTAAGGATLGPAMAFGYRAGEAAVSDP